MKRTYKSGACKRRERLEEQQRRKDSVKFSYALTSYFCKSTGAASVNACAVQIYGLRWERRGPLCPGYVVEDEDETRDTDQHCQRMLTVVRLVMYMSLTLTLMIAQHTLHSQHSLQVSAHPLLTESYPTDPYLFRNKILATSTIRALLKHGPCQPGLNDEYNDFPFN